LETTRSPEKKFFTHGGGGRRKRGNGPGLTEKLGGKLSGEKVRSDLLKKEALTVNFDMKGERGF